MNRICPICGKEVIFTSRKCSLLRRIVHMECCTRRCPLRGQGFCLGKHIVRLLSERPLSQRELEEIMGLEPGKLTSAVKLLERLGIIETTYEGLRTKARGYTP
ncbi:MAG: hypothetical protein DRN15_03175 [Thermoprotei archaeon]|nr:MAG: hypothetical protein DRN15_03175 [Thermoprotei archaeon]RLF24977.1 MAG: hypothetical protein DRM97_02745 [Thermoprotei archaeon]